MNQEHDLKEQKVTVQIVIEAHASLTDNPSECMKTIQEFYENSLKIIIETCLNENGLIPDDPYLKGMDLKDFNLAPQPPQVHQSRQT